MGEKRPISEARWPLEPWECVVDGPQCRHTTECIVINSDSTTDANT